MSFNMLDNDHQPAPYEPPTCEDESVTAGDRTPLTFTPAQSDYGFGNDQQSRQYAASNTSFLSQNGQSHEKSTSLTGPGVRPLSKRQVKRAISTALTAYLTATHHNATMADPNYEAEMIRSMKVIKKGMSQLNPEYYPWLMDESELWPQRTETQRDTELITFLKEARAIPETTKAALNAATLPDGSAKAGLAGFCARLEMADLSDKEDEQEFDDSYDQGDSF